MYYRSGAVSAAGLLLMHDVPMDESVIADDRWAHDALERIMIFRELAGEYSELVELVGNIEEPKPGTDLAPRDRMALYVRMMLERKFMVKNDRNTYIPNVVEALRKYLSDDNSIYLLDFHAWFFEGVASGRATRSSGEFNGVELDYVKTREMVTYGRLVHSDRNKLIRSRILKEMSHGLMLRQSMQVGIIIAQLRSLIDVGVESGTIPSESESLEATWLDIHNRPELYDIGIARIHGQPEEECQLTGLPCAGAPFKCPVCPRQAEGGP